jgi:FkbM family methyltransferase
MLITHLKGITMRRLTSRILQKVGQILINLAKCIYQTPQQKRVALWFRDEGDKILLLSHDLDENSLVFDLGGYEGQWTSDIFSTYCCWIHVFELVEELADKMEKRFSRNERIVVHRFGLSSENRIVQVSVNGTSSSIYRLGNDVREGRLIRAVDFMRENHIEKIDLMKINIEGGEYDLLDHLIESGYAPRIKNIEVQFHDHCVPNAEQRMSNIQSQLKRTHYLTYQYLFVWENWRLKE